MGTTMMMMSTAIPIPIMIRILMSFHHICLRTRLAPRRKPCAEAARVSAKSAGRRTGPTRSAMRYQEAMWFHLPFPSNVDPRSHATFAPQQQTKCI